MIDFPIFPCTKLYILTIFPKNLFTHSILHIPFLLCFFFNYSIQLFINTLRFIFQQFPVLIYQSYINVHIPFNFPTFFHQPNMEQTVQVLYTGDTLYLALFSGANPPKVESRSRNLTGKPVKYIIISTGKPVTSVISQVNQSCQ